MFAAVCSAQTGTLVVLPSQLLFAAVEGQVAPAQNISIKSTSGAIAFTVQTPDTLIASPSSGTATPDTSVTVAISPKSAVPSCTALSFQCSPQGFIDVIDVRSAAQDVEVSVEMDITPKYTSTGLTATVAGTDYSFQGDGKPSTNAQLGDVRTLAVDAAGNVYFTDNLNAAVFKVDAAGIITRVAGNGLSESGYPRGDGGPAVAASLDTSSYLGVGLLKVGLGPDGSIYIVEGSYQAFRVRKVDLRGIITTLYAGNGPAPSTVEIPTAVAVAPSGVVYLLDYGGVRSIGTDGIIRLFAGEPPTCCFSGLTALAVDPQGNVFVADQHTIFKITPSGAVSTFARGASSTIAVAGMAADARGNLYVADGISTVSKIAPSGVITAIAGSKVQGFAGDGGPAGAAVFNAPSGVGVNAAGDIFVADSGNHRVRKISAQGVVSTFAGNGKFLGFPDGTVATSATLYGARGMAIDASGNLYTADYLSSDDGSGRILKVDRRGLISVVAGNSLCCFSGDGQPANQASINGPSGVAVDSAGNIYFTDTNNFRVRKIDTSGIISTIAGTGVQGRSTNGPAVKSPLYAPAGIAIDAAGIVYFTDNGWVRKVDKTGLLTTVAGMGVLGYIPPCPDGTLALSCYFDGLNGIAIDGAQNIVVAVGNPLYSPNDGRFRKINASGVVSTLPVTIPESDFIPYGLAFGPDGSLWINGCNCGIGPGGVLPPSIGETIYKVSGGTATRAAPANFAFGSVTFLDTAGNGGLAVDAAGNVYFRYGGTIHEILARNPQLLVSAAAFSFTGQSKGAPAPVQSFSVSALMPDSALSFPGLAFSVSVDDKSVNWLSVTPLSGVTPRLVDVVANPANLSAGVYQGTITISAPNGNPASVTVNVTFTVAPSAPAALSLDRQSVSFSFPRSAAPQTQRLTVANSGSGALAIAATAAITTPPGGKKWLLLSAASGQALPAAPFALNVTADPSGLPPGTYSGTVTITSPGGNVAVPVVMTISPSDQAILLSQRGLSFTAVAGGGIVPPQTFSILNIGTASVAWQVSTSTLPAGLGWLLATPSSGNTGPNAQFASTITVSVNPAVPAPGSYYGLVRVDAALAANTPQVVTVFLQVLPPGTDTGAVVQPGTLIFTTSLFGELTGSQTVSVYNITGDPKSFRATLDGTAGIVLLPADATLDPRQGTSIVVQPQAMCGKYLYCYVDPGTYTSTLSFQFSDGRVAQVNVKVIVPAPGAPGVSPAVRMRGSVPYDAASCSPTKLFPALNTLPNSFQVSAGWPVALSAAVKDDCGAPLLSGSVIVNFSNGDPSIALQALGDGRWEGTWPTQKGAGSQVTVKLHAENPGSQISGDQQVSGGLQTLQQPPAFDSAGVVAIFGGPSFEPLAPGSVISVYGDRLAESEAPSTAVPLGTQLVNTQVSLAGRKMPLYYVSQGQVNAIVPYGVNTNVPQQLLVQRGLTLSLPLSLNVAETLPSLLPLATDYPANGGVPYPVSADAPAHAGDTLVFYSSGLGAVTPAVADGAAAGAALSSTNNAAQLLIGGQPAKVVFSGLAPGFPGLYQVNAVIAPGTPTGSALVTLTIAGQTSQPVTIAIQ